MYQLIQKVEEKYRKSAIVDVRTGDTVRVHQKIKEGAKERVQIFEGLVIRTDRKDSLTSRITVRHLSSGVWVEKSFLLHSPLVLKVEVTKRAKVRRKYLTYMRDRSGKSARLAAIDFDKRAVNEIKDKKVEEEIEHMKEEAAETHEQEAAAKEDKK
jgi:large subunit ribosomal protein L19